MSYSYSGVGLDAEEAGRQVYGGLTDIAADSPNANVGSEIADHATGIEDAMALLVDALGGPSKVSVQITGHANPGHAPREGFANDYIGLTVTGMEYGTEAEPGTEPAPDGEADAMVGTPPSDAEPENVGTPPVQDGEPRPAAVDGGTVGT